MSMAGQNKIIATLVNGDFETGSGTTNANFSVTGWAVTSVGAATVVSVDTTTYSGAQAIKMVVDAGNSNNGIRSTPVMTVTPSTAYRLSLFVKSDTAGALQIKLRKAVASGDSLQSDGTWGAASSYFTVTTTTSWAEYTLDFTTDVGQTTLCIDDFKRSGLTSQASRTFWIDKVSIFSPYDIPDKHSATLYGLTKPGAGWDYDDPYLTYDGATDNEGRAVLYDSIGSATIMTPLAKNNA